MREERVKKVERSLPVNARVDIVDIANATVYWEKNGYEIRSVSQLINWSMDLFCSMLRKAELIEDREVSVSKAYNMLEERGMWTRSMEKFGKKKLLHAMRSEEIRNMGGDPRVDAPEQYNQVHNKQSVQVRPIEGDNHIPKRKNYAERKREEREAIKKGPSPGSPEFLKKAEEMYYKLEADNRRKAMMEQMERDKARIREMADENGIIQNPVNKRANYTEEDMRKKIERERQDAMSRKEKSKESRKRLASDMPRKMSEEEIDETAKRIAEKDKREAELQASLLLPKNG